MRDDPYPHLESRHPRTGARSFRVTTRQIVISGLLVAWAARVVLSGENAAPAMGAVAGTLTNAVLALSLTVIKYRTFTPGTAFFLGLTNGLPEIILAVLVVTLLYRGGQASLDRR